MQHTQKKTTNCETATNKLEHDIKVSYHNAGNYQHDISVSFRTEHSHPDSTNTRVESQQSDTG